VLVKGGELAEGRGRKKRKYQVPPRKSLPRTRLFGAGMRRKDEGGGTTGRHALRAGGLQKKVRGLNARLQLVQQYDRSIGGRLYLIAKKKTGQKNRRKKRVAGSKKKKKASGDLLSMTC